MKTDAAAGTPAEILHPLTKALIAPPTIHMKNRRRIWVRSRPAAAAMPTIANTTNHRVVGCRRTARESPWPRCEAPNPRCPSRLDWLPPPPPASVPWHRVPLPPRPMPAAATAGSFAMGWGLAVLGSDPPGAALWWRRWDLIPRAPPYDGGAKGSFPWRSRKKQGTSSIGCRKQIHMITSQLETTLRPNKCRVLNQRHLFWDRELQPIKRT